MVWRPCSRDASPSFSPCPAKPPANPTALSHLHTFLFLPFSQHHHYPKTLLGFVLFRSAILSMGFVCCLLRKKGHGNFALQAIKEDIQKVQILSTN